MYLLDTDIISNILDIRRASGHLRDRLRSEPFDELAISVVTVEEVLRGTLDALRRSQMRKQNVVEAYEELRLSYGQLYRFQVLPYSYGAESVFKSFSRSILRIGANDCRIAAIALAQGCVVVTANTQHFNRIPGLTTEDWTLG